MWDRVMYADLAVFSDTDIVAETVAAARLLCLPRGRIRVFVPEGARDVSRERALLERMAGAGIHVSLNSIDPTEAGNRAVFRIVPTCQAIAVVRPEGVGLNLGVLERALLKHSPVPIWFWNNRTIVDLRIVVASCPDPQDARRDGLNDNTIELAGDLAVRGRGTIVLSSAWQLDGEDDMRSSPFLRVSEDEIAAVREDIETGLANWLEVLASRCRLRGVAVETELREGPAEQMIPVIAEEKAASVMVVGTMKRRGIAALIRPNTVVSLARGFRGSLAVVPPKDVVAEVGGGGLSRIAAGISFA